MPVAEYIFGNSIPFFVYVVIGVLDATLEGLTEKKEAPAIFFPGVSVDTNVYRYIKMEVKSDVMPQSKGFSHGFYFSSTTAAGFSESKKVSVDLKQKSDDFVEYTFDMGANGDWGGTVTGIFYSFNDLTGHVQIKNIRFVEGKPVKKWLKKRKLQKIPPKR